MILVTGATGRVGREVVRLLADRGPVRALVRSPERLAALGPCGAGVEVAVGRYEQPETIAAALRGIRRAFLVTTDPFRPDDEVFLGEARRAGVEHVVKLSALAAAEEDAQDLISRRQRAAEQALRTSGLGWTLLRPRAFMSNSLAWADDIRSTGVVSALHGDAPAAVIDPRDVAEAAVHALTQARCVDTALALTGPEALSARERTARLAGLLGRPLGFRELTVEEARAGLVLRYPPQVVDALLESAVRLLDGRKAAVEPDFTATTGLLPRCFDVWAADHLSAFAAVA
ncbi:NAD(P)H-binding protein [Streptacidiphilus jiangxiensis]|uniref:Uncharacterized conserved protein YbjT, contains NAD(P)-binding and DUF2867 domains n=1 Tax=Streptacidiphilus jiangxiensis TaxID=235985 RepID=A0A1H7KHX2_STRJI|nr:NAD(P)H-binding protein [Streptacidiphilus jiangxiensis]SEK86096.1 Uncharacterized conserved protein YbjT, contains NAD(P)-binding and DUF2867 domains [Streptacidiphilus jiangxiensis]